jgi:hypothetical protein
MSKTQSPEIEASKAVVKVRELEASLTAVSQSAALKAAQKHRAKIDAVVTALSPEALIAYEKLTA